MKVNKFGITGGIGSGKTYISLLLEKRGFSIFNCDQTAKNLILKDVSLQADLSALIGRPVVTDAGELDKNVISAYLFSSEEHVKKVNGLVHPRVRKAFLKWVREEEKKRKISAGNLTRQWVGMECSILFEAHFDDLVDFVISVYAPETVRLKRVEERDGLDAKQVESRIACQLPEGEKLKRSDFIIRNDGGDLIETQLDELRSILITRSYNELD